MTVAELIEELNKFPQDYQVFVWNNVLDPTLMDPQPGAEDIYLDGIDMTIKAVTLN